MRLVARAMAAPAALAGPAAMSCLMRLFQAQTFRQLTARGHIATCSVPPQGGLVCTYCPGTRKSALVTIVAAGWSMLIFHFDSIVGVWIRANNDDDSEREGEGGGNDGKVEEKKMEQDTKKYLIE